MSRSTKRKISDNIGKEVARELNKFSKAMKRLERLTETPIEECCIYCSEPAVLECWNQFEQPICKECYTDIRG